MNCHPAKSGSHSHLGRPQDQMVLWFHGWEPLMLSHHPAKFGGQWHCGSKDMIFLALTSIPHYCLSLKYMECNALTHKISGYKHNNKPVCPMKDFRSWLHMSTRATDGSYFKTFHQFVQKRRREGKRKQKLEWQLQSFLRYTQTQKSLEWQFQSFLRCTQTQSGFIFSLKRLESTYEQKVFVALV